MFSINSGKRIPKLSEVHQFWSCDPKGKLVIDFLSSLEKITPSLDDTSLEDIQLPPCGPVENINPDHAPEDRFMDANNDKLLDFDFPQLSDLHEPRENKGLPPDFIRNVCLNRIFTEPWEDSDFENSISGLDYLSNLECTRRTALREVAQRLNISERTWRSVLTDSHAARAWVYSIQEQEDEIEQSYSKIWVNLRIWAMIKELQSKRLYKPGAIAMLNTLFPPVIKELPSPRISEKVLYGYRNNFYRYIVSIEANGNSVLDGFIAQLSHPGTPHTWPNTIQSLKDYIRLAESMIKQATAVHGISFFKSLLEEHPAMRSHSGSGTASDLSGLTYVSNGSTKPGQDEINRMSTKSGDRCGNIDDNVSSVGSIILGDDSLDPNFVAFSRSRVSGKLATQDDVDTPFTGSTSSIWHLSARPQSDISGQVSLETYSSSAKLHSSSFSRPKTPSCERQKIHRPSLSPTRGIPYEFQNTPPRTLELPSTQANEGRDVLKAPAMSQVNLLSDRSAFVQEPHEPVAPVTKQKKSAFSVFRRKKKSNELLDYKKIDKIDKERSHEQPALTVKSSFAFLKPFKRHDDLRSVSVSDSERTVTDETIQPRLKLKPKKSLNNIFAKKVHGTSVEENKNSSAVGNTAGTLLARHTLRKARSCSSVKSSSSAYSNDGARNAQGSGIFGLSGEDRVITSADITEPFPFRTFVQPQTPAVIFEDLEESKYIEDVRKGLLEKARKERMAKWEQSEESKCRLEAARERRRMLREEMDGNTQVSKITNQKQKVEKKAPAKPVLMTPDHGAHSSDKPPKTPLKTRILREFANCYSPTS